MNKYEKYMNEFDAEKVKDRIVSWIREWFEYNGKDCNAVIGISGGKDSAVVAGLCVEALGKDRVFGILLPKHNQPDIQDAYDICDHLGIRYHETNIGMIYNTMAISLDLALSEVNESMSEQAKINLPARIRMCMLYGMSQSLNGRVANTCNYSEDYVGYSTIYGDTAGDFAPLKELTSDEVIAIGLTLNLPENLLAKVPSDGLCGKTDEENLGFSYAVLNRYIRTDEIDDEGTKNKIDYLHKINAFKECTIDRFYYSPIKRSEE